MGNFGAVTTYSTGTGSTPVALAVADVNGDGKPDVLTANQATSTAGVLLGTGTGSFGAVTAYSTGSGSQPYSIAVADVNGDGKPDLLTAHVGNGNKTGVLLGTGTGSFGAVATYSMGAGSGANAIVAVDVNGDRQPDLLTANQSGSTVSVLLNTYTPLAAAANSASTPVALYPNPTTHAAKLTGTAPGQQVQVYDALGRVALTTQADAAGTVSFTLPAGLYLVRSGAGPALRLAVQ